MYLQQINGYYNNGDNMKKNRKLMVASNEKYNNHMKYEMSKELGVTSVDLSKKNAFGQESNNLINCFDRYTENKKDINK